MSYTSHLNFRQGDDVSFVITILDDVGQSLNVSGHIVKWALAASETSSGLIAKSYPASGITATNPITNIVTVAISGYELSALTPGMYFHQAKVIVSGNTDTVIVGTVRIKPSII